MLINQNESERPSTLIEIPFVFKCLDDAIKVSLVWSICYFNVNAPCLTWRAQYLLPSVSNIRVVVCVGFHISIPSMFYYCYSYVGSIVAFIWPLCLLLPKSIFCYLVSRCRCICASSVFAITPFVLFILFFLILFKQIRHSDDDMV